MRLWKVLLFVAGLYAAFVLAFEAIYLGHYQPSFELRGIPMLVLTTTDESGESNDRMLAGLRTGGKLYVSAHHWPRGWYRRAVEHPDVVVSVDDVRENYRAVQIEGEEFERVAARFPIPLRARFLMGFPPPRGILRLDPVAPEAAEEESTEAESAGAEEQAPDLEGGAK